MKEEREIIRQLEERMNLTINSITSKLLHEETADESDWVQGFNQGVLETNQFYLDMIDTLVRQQEV